MLLDNFNSSLIQKLTIIIPTYQRQKFVIRTMQYWSGKGPKVILLDGSEKALDRNILKHIQSNVIYIHNPVSVYERIFSAISLVDTEYVMYGSDDEFYILSALNSCLTKLSLDSKFVACCGRAVGFKWYNNSVVGYNIYPNFKDLILDNPNSLDRLIKHFSNYVPSHIYAVCRASVWKNAAQMTFSKEYNFFAASELQMEFLLVYAGRTLVIPELMWMRSDENAQNYNTSKSTIPALTFYKWWFDKKNRKEKEDFISRIEFACRQISKMKKNDNVPKVQTIFEIYLKSEKPFIFLRFFRYFPGFIRYMIKIIFKFFRYDVTKKTLLLDVARSLEKTGVKVNFDEIKFLEQCICSFYKDQKK